MIKAVEDSLWCCCVGLGTLGAPATVKVERTTYSALRPIEDVSGIFLMGRFKKEIWGSSPQCWGEGIGMMLYLSLPILTGEFYLGFMEISRREFGCLWWILTYDVTADLFRFSG